MYEIYETDSTYCIGINNFTGIVYLNYDEIITIIDYMCKSDFIPVYLKNHNQKANWIKKHSSGKTQESATNITVYTLDNLNVKLINNKFRVQWGDKDMGVKLNQPVAHPVKFKNRYIIVDNNKFYAFEDGKKVNDSQVEYVLVVDYTFVNDVIIDVDDNLLLIYRNNDRKRGADYTYSYKTNKVYKLKD